MKTNTWKNTSQNFGQSFNQRASRLCKWAVLTLSAAVLVACGGGGSPAAVTPGATPQNEIAFNPNVKVIASASVVPSSATVSSTGSLQLGLVGSQSLAVGDIVMIESGVSGLTNAYPGKITSITNTSGVTTATLVRAGIADVFTKLNIKYDSTDGSGTQAGLAVRKVITAPGVVAKFESKPVTTAGLQAGIAQTLCGVTTQAGVKWANEIVCDYSKGTLSGELSLSKDILVTKTATGEKVGATWKAYFLLNDVKQVLNTNFDELASRTPSKSDYFKAELSGKVAAGVRLETPDENSKYEWALSDLISSSTGADFFNDLEWKLKLAELKGLNADDKAGLLPVAGLVIDAQCVAATAASGGAAAWTACGFKGFDEARVSLGKPLSFILWAYVRADGSLKLSGSLDIVEMSGYEFQKGIEYTYDGGAKTINKTISEPTLSMLKLNGAADVDLSVGGELAMDFLVGGIRPAAVHFEAYRYEQNYHAEGNAGFQVFPTFKPIGEICYYGAYTATSRMKVLAQIKAAIGDPDWFQLESGFQWAAEPIHTWASGPLISPTCISSQALNYEIQRVGQAADNEFVWTYKVSFAESYANLKNTIGRWDIVLNGNETREVTPDENGQVFIDLPAGRTYTVELRAWHVFDDGPDVNGKLPEAIKARKAQNLVTPDIPTIGSLLSGVPVFATVGQQVSLWVNTTLANIHTVVWNFTDSAADVTVNGTADLLGKVGSTLKTFNVQGTQTVKATLQDFFGNKIAQRSMTITVQPGTVTTTAEITQVINDNTTPNSFIPKDTTTTDSTPKITGTVSVALGTGDAVRVYAGTTLLGTATTTGTNWVLTDGTALAAGARTLKAVVYNAYSMVEGSNANTWSITVTDGTVTTGSLPDTGITSSQCYAAGSNTLVSCTSAAAIALSPTQDGMVGRDVTSPSNTDGKLGFSYSQVGSYPITDCVKDNITGLVWEGKPASGTRGSPEFDPNDLYNNGGSESPYSTQSYANAVNTQGLCGYDDWRLPTSKELVNLVDYGVGLLGSAKIDGNWFPNTKVDDFYWSSSVAPPIFSSSSTYFVSFKRGVLDHTDLGTGGHVRLVRGTTSTHTYTYSVDGSEVTDSATGLTWRRCSEGQTWSAGTCIGTATQYTHENALLRAKSEASASSKAWRVPNVKELTSIAQLGERTYPTIDTVAFPTLTSSADTQNWYWSSTTDSGDPTKAWLVAFSVGYVDTRPRWTYRIRLVR